MHPLRILAQRRRLPGEPCRNRTEFRAPTTGSLRRLLQEIRADEELAFV